MNIGDVNFLSNIYQERRKKRCRDMFLKVGLDFSIKFLTNLNIGLRWLLKIPGFPYSKKTIICRHLD